MKKLNAFLSCLLISLLISCSETKQTIHMLSFEKVKSVSLDKANFKAEKIIPLELTESSAIGDLPTIGYDIDFFVYSRNNEHVVHRFDNQGKYMNSIGNVGSGPEEYAHLEDMSVDPETRTISLLTSNGIFKYNYSGDYVSQTKAPYPAFAFYYDPYGNYWFYSGNAKNMNPYKLMKHDSKLIPTDDFIEADLNLLPWGENNIHKNGEMITFHESFDNNGYKIENGKVMNQYAIDFGDLNLNREDIPSDPMSFIAYIRTQNYAVIRSYLENKKYVYFHIAENRANEKPNVYHWFINKENSKQLLMKQDTDLEQESYLFSPQLLDQDNFLYFIGYMPGESDEVNPSIVGVDLSQLNYM
ncbi:MAG: 6-bladed beta-propeller [Bacteroidales bacterium]